MTMGNLLSDTQVSTCMRNNHIHTKYINIHRV